MSERPSSKRPGKMPESFQITRHLQPLSPQETDDLAGLVADLVVDYVKKKGALAPTAEIERDAQFKGEKPVAPVVHEDDEEPSHG